MTTKALGLSDADIDRLLAEAESRLAGNGGPGAVAALPAKAAVAATAPLAPTAGEQTAVPEKKSEKLSVRVPQPAQKKKGPKDNLGSDWFNMPRTNLTPELKRDLQILRMRDVVAMGKQFFKRDSRKNFIPEYCQVGTIVAGATDGVNGRLTRKEKKRTIVEEVLSGENLAKFKSKYHDIQEQKMSGRKGYYKKLVAGRRKRNG
ncbi:Tryptophan--tRNA ligase, mitochondrial [Madurella fahalii]|uniref:Tryptophan--tRNA ligase, mitochondrial n=1 Tax=Madurella fahalii TaxID=1157608 RepID=A0ABQ0GQT6_9PEZI